MRLHFLPLAFLIPAAQAHDVITTALTFNREISRILHQKCASCHRSGGSAFSLLTYAEARPWAVAIKEEVLRRRMPPWGAVKGFGEFRNDQGLSSEELEYLISWIDGGVPEGEAKDLPAPPKFTGSKPYKIPRGTLALKADIKLSRAFALDGILPNSAPRESSIQLVAELPDGSLEPLLWLDGYRPEFEHPFLFRAPLTLPAGTWVRGVPPGAAFTLLPATGVPRP
jgi:hypothetical protein